MRCVFYAPNFPPTEADLAAARAAGATEIVQGEGGYREIAEPGDAREEQVAMALKRLASRRGSAISGFHAVVQGADYPIGLTVQTQADIAAALRHLEGRAAGETVDWEVVDGAWLALTRAELEAIFTAAWTWVQACYAASKALGAEIAAAEAPLAVDLERGWPA